MAVSNFIPAEGSSHVSQNLPILQSRKVETEIQQARAFPSTHQVSGFQGFKRDTEPLMAKYPTLTE